MTLGLDCTNISLLEFFVIALFESSSKVELSSSRIAQGTTLERLWTSGLRVAFVERSRLGGRGKLSRRRCAIYVNFQRSFDYV